MSKRTVIHARPSMLKFDRQYQRAVDPVRVKTLVDNFNPSGIGTLTVSLRSNGELVIIDGQHRGTAARSIGYDEKVPCIQYAGLTLAEEAELFLALNNVKPVSALDKFRARIIAGDAGATAINEVLSAFGWRVQAGGDAGCFAAVNAIEKVYEGAGVTRGEPRLDLVRIVTTVITAAWDRDPKGTHNLIVSGLGTFYARYGDAVDSAKVVTELRKLSPHRLVGLAQSLHEARGGTKSSALAEVVTGLHNKGRRTNRLPDWRWSR